MRASLLLLRSIRALTNSTLFPYTTLFRSHFCVSPLPFKKSPGQKPAPGQIAIARGIKRWLLFSLLRLQVRPFACAERSEEHTSELQSHVNLVCRLLLEKKKTCSACSSRSE